MFEGIVGGLGRVVEVRDGAGIRRLRVDCGDIGEPRTSGQQGAFRNQRTFDAVDMGSSIAINGVCLTAIECTSRAFGFDVIAETLARTNLGLVECNDRVNVELPLRFGSGIDGHLVQGHVDGQAEIVGLTRGCDDVRLTVCLPSELMEFVVMKGSIAIDGISLTVATVDRANHEVSVALIPYTLEVTTLGFRRVGDRVNIETDHQVKVVRAALSDVMEGFSRRLEELESRVTALTVSEGRISTAD